MPAVMKESVTSSSASNRYTRYVFAILFITSVLNYLDRYVFVGAANTLAKELNFRLDGIGSMISVFQLVYTLSTIPFSIWADRAQRKHVVAVCLVLWSAVTVLIAFSVNFVMIFLLLLLLGIGEAGYFPAAVALISEYFSRERRSRVMSWWSTAQLFGMLGGLALGGAIAGLGPGKWRLAFFICGLPGLLIAYWAFRVREPRQQSLHAEEDEGDLAAAQAMVVPHNVFQQFWTLLRIKTLVALIAMQIFAFFVLSVSTSFLPTYLQQKDTFGFNPGQAGLYSGGIIVAGGMVGMILGGYVADRLSRRYPGARVLVCGIAFLVSAPTFALAVAYHNIIIFTTFFVVTALMLAMYTGPSMAATQDVVPSELRASAVALSLLIAHLLGDTFSPALVGFLATSFDPTHGLHFKNSVAGQELSLAILITCAPALLLAGLIGLFGSRWMKSDMISSQ